MQKIEKDERYWCKELEKIAPQVGARAYIFKDNGRRKFNPIPFDSIVYFPEQGNNFAFVEAKEENKKLSDKQMEFAIKCATDKAKHFVLRIFNEMFTLSVIDIDGKERGQQDWSYSTLNDLIYAIGKMI